ncbi:MAG: cytochrome c family protein [Proteobacteria bacterium]|nr:cytochrome c family protein [Pseudomonadota bacterium]
MMMRNGFGALAVLALAACGGETGGATDPELADVQALAALPPPYNTADPLNGRRVFNQCRSCHTIEAGAPNLVGPNLHGVFERRIGTLPGYTYSEAARSAGWSWDAAQLDRWLTDPRGFLPGTKMAFPGVKDPTDRRDVIAYLLIETRKPAED